MKALRILIVLIAAILAIALVLYLKPKPAEGGLKVTISADKPEYWSGQIVNMTVTILNNGPNPITIEFASSQRYDFIILKNNNEIWRWSADKAFAQVIGSVTLQPGEKQSYFETWKTTQVGTYTLIGIITSKPKYEAKTSFKVNP
ncbi:MAG: BsuPI-related putative proteinase inhibitor [Euryarchaeota archaeon]|nr:BsuPI-related putative proteinase inhibitor [Euryarchaeota archaeon]